MKAIGPPPQPAGYVARLDGLPLAPSRGDGTRVWLVRHAEVFEDWHDKAYGSLDVPLSNAGARDSAQLGEAFAAIAVDAVLSSDLTRALTMGEHIARATSAPISVTPALREMNRGDWQGLTKTEFIDHWHADAERYWQDPYRWHAPGGEGDQLLYERAWPTVEAALAPLPGGCLVVAAHGQLIRVLISRMLGLSVPDSYAYYPDPAHATLLVDDAGGWRIEARNLDAASLA